MLLQLKRSDRASARTRDGWTALLPGFAQDLCWSPDSATLAVATLAGPVLLFAAADGAKIGEDEGHRHGALKVAFSPTGDRVVSSGQDGNIISWSTGDGPRVRRRGGAPWIDALAWDDRGERLASAAGHAVRLWTPELDLIGELHGYDRAVRSVFWQRGTTKLATVAGTSVSFVDLATSSGPVALERNSEILTVCIDPAGRQIATSLSGGSLHVWSSQSKRDLQMLGYRSPVRVMAWSSESDLLATASRGEIAVWNLGGASPAVGRPSMLLGHTGNVTGLGFIADDRRLLSCDDAGALVNWRWLGGRFYLDSMRKLGGPLSSLQLSPDGRFAAVALADGGLRCWRI
jgi:WD40 repeat protein